MGPYGSVGAHIKNGRSPVAQDHLKSPTDPKMGHGMTKNPQTSKKKLLNSEGFLAEVFHPWVCWEGPGSGFENSSGGAARAGGGVWKSRIWPPWDLGRKIKFSNGMAYKRSKVSVKKSQIRFVVTNFSRSIFPYT